MGGNQAGFAGIRGYFPVYFTSGAASKGLLLYPPEDFQGPGLGVQFWWIHRAVQGALDCPDALGVHPCSVSIAPRFTSSARHRLEQRRQASTAMRFARVR
jgi:hypothetical protein